MDPSRIHLLPELTKVRAEARRIVESGHRSLVAVGGDGLLSEVITGVVQAIDGRGFQDAVDLTIVACGSGNDLYRKINRSQPGRVRRIAWMERTDPELPFGSGAVLLFAGGGGLGYGPLAVAEERRRRHPRLTRLEVGLGHRLTYIAPLMQALAQAQPEELAVTSNGEDRCYRGVYLYGAGPDREVLGVDIAAGLPPGSAAGVTGFVVTAASKRDLVVSLARSLITGRPVSVGKTRFAVFQTDGEVTMKPRFRGEGAPIHRDAILVGEVESLTISPKENVRILF
jgi:hypothetical protein